MGETLEALVNGRVFALLDGLRDFGAYWIQVDVSHSGYNGVIIQESARKKPLVKKVTIRIVLAVSPSCDRLFQKFHEHG